MSVGEPQTALRFSLGGTAFQIACGLLMMGLCAWAFYTFCFHLEGVPEYSRRYQFVADFLRSNNGAPGAIVSAIFGLCFAWWTWRAIRRFFAAGPAAALTEHGLVLHPIYRYGAEIGFGDIVSAKVWREQYLIHSLYLRLAEGQTIKLRSNTIEGGTEALRAFARELNAQRTFGGDGHGDGVPSPDAESK